MSDVLVVVRVWLPDRPGALGAVASRIGAVRGDVIAIDVLERGGGRAVDELTVSLPGEGLVELLVQEIGQVDGVDVEDVRAVAGGDRDRAVAALDAARALLAVDDEDDLFRVACRVTRSLVSADWVAIVNLEISEIVAMAGAPTETAEWLSAFIHGAGAQGAISELAFCPLPAGCWLVVSRSALPLRHAERQLIEELAGIAAQLDAQLRERSTARSH